MSKPYSQPKTTKWQAKMKKTQVKMAKALTTQHWTQVEPVLTARQLGRAAEVRVFGA
jgi:hypothetical protein